MSVYGGCVCVQVAALGLRALRGELSRRGLDATGSRGALEARLVSALSAESKVRLFCLCA